MFWKLNWKYYVRLQSQWSVNTFKARTAPTNVFSNKYFDWWETLRDDVLDITTVTQQDKTVFLSGEGDFRPQASYLLFIFTSSLTPLKEEVPRIHAAKNSIMWCKEKNQAVAFAAREEIIFFYIFFIRLVFYLNPYFVAKFVHVRTTIGPKI